jgi:phosphatidate cytidylyltransferase
MAAPEIPLEAAPGRRAPSQLLLRLGSAMVLVVLSLAAVVAGPLTTSILFGVVLVVSLAEFFWITRRMGVPAAPWVLFPLALLFFFRFQLDGLGTVLLSIGLTLAVGAGLTAFLLARGPVDAMTRWALGIAGALYLGWMLGFYMALYTARNPDPGRVGFAWLLALVGSTILGDTAALLVGTRFGRHRFFPAISPKKSLEGSVAGFVVQVLTFAFFGVIAEVRLPHAFVLGALVAVAAQAGDLIESQFKRAANLKDASPLIPGHGGMLDRLDSLILIPGVAYYYMTLLLHVKLPQ